MHRCIEGLEAVGLLLSRGICVRTALPFCLSLPPDGTRAFTAALEHAMVLILSECEPVTLCPPQPAPLTPQRSILPFGPFLWHIHRRHPVITSFSVLSFSTCPHIFHLVVIFKSPALSGLDRVRAAPCHCKLLLCSSITLGFKERTQGCQCASAVRYTRVWSMWQRDAIELCLHLCRCYEKQPGCIKTTLSMHALAFYPTFS